FSLVTDVSICKPSTESVDTTRSRTRGAGGALGSSGSGGAMGSEGAAAIGWTGLASAARASCATGGAAITGDGRVPTGAGVGHEVVGRPGGEERTRRTCRDARGDNDRDSGRSDFHGSPSEQGLCPRSSANSRELSGQFRQQAVSNPGCCPQLWARFFVR